MLNDCAIIIPVYNEGSVLAEVLQKVATLKCGIICIDDGSADDSAAIIRASKAVLIRHPVNAGQGAALQTGIEYALQFPTCKYFVTFDADGQHSIEDVRNMLSIIKAEKLDVVLGSRFLGSAHKIGNKKKLLLKAAIAFTNAFSKVQLTDTHNGLRVFNRAFAQALDIRMPDMAHASEIIDKLGRGNWQYKEVPVTIQYDAYSRSKGQSMFNSFNILFDLLLQRRSKR